MTIKSSNINHSINWYIAFCFYVYSLPIVKFMADTVRKYIEMLC